eukprot:Lithocolla_globosa_v1_NODE_1362_length_2632_cov_5.112534.p1 type:complete len:420 gc:universal NODE_1362_length_2632_cov_5.112534:768-2027(+)
MVLQGAKRFLFDQKSVWQVMTPLANKVGAVNLGQGFPNFDTPDYVKKAASVAFSHEPLNQYSPVTGLPHLRESLTKYYSPAFKRSIDPLNEVVISQGATEGTFSIMQGIVDPGDEVIVLDPWYDMYVPSITMAGGVPVHIPLRSPDREPGSGSYSSSQWHLDLEELESAISSRTKVLFLNTPHNPVGKIFSREELVKIGEIAKKHDLIVLSDEVYDHLTFDRSHVSIASLPGMWERTLTVGSAGKVFSMTGWKIGWVLGPEHLIKYVERAHGRVTFCATTPLQEAIAVGFDEGIERNFFETQRLDLLSKRQKMVSAFEQLGLSCVIPEGTYFMLVETSSIQLPSSVEESISEKDNPRDWAIAKWLTTDIGVAAIPPSAFYSPQFAHLSRGYVRFAFCKTDATLDEAILRLQKLKKFINK